MDAREERNIEIGKLDLAGEMRLQDFLGALANQLMDSGLQPVERDEEQEDEAASNNNDPS
jgi:hypothetical protein